jgi:hypothetical protein
MCPRADISYFVVKTPKHSLQRCDDLLWHKSYSIGSEVATRNRYINMIPQLANLQERGSRIRLKWPYQKTAPSAQPSEEYWLSYHSQMCRIHSIIWRSFFKHLTSVSNIEHTQKNVAVSKAITIISHPTRPQQTLSTAGNVQRFSCATSNSLLMLTAGPRGQVSKITSQKAFCMPRFEKSRSVITVQREFRAGF